MSVSRMLRFLAVAALSALALPAAAQWTHSPPPADSAYWWTLTDSLTPAELRAELADREAHRRRFIAAVTAQTGNPPTDEAVEALKIYVTEPHLWPMYDVFVTLALNWEPGGYPSERIPGELKKAGLSQTAIEEILRVCEEYSVKRARAVEEYRAIHDEWMAIARQVEQVVGKERRDAAIQTAQPNLDLVAQLSGRSTEEVAKMHRIWYTDTLSPPAVEAIESLKASLPSKDWALLRKYFLHELAPQMSMIDFEE
jgi:hypothetical protein